MKSWASRRNVKLAVMFGLLHEYAFLRNAYFGDVADGWAVTVGVTMSLCLVAILGGMVARGRGFSLSSRAVQWVGYTALGFFSSVMVLTLLRDVILIAGWVAGCDWPPLALVSSYVVFGFASLATLVGFFNAMRVAGVKTVEIQVDGLPMGLEGFTIAQLSDVHIGPFVRRRYVEKIVAKVNSMGAHMVAITGDVVDGPVHSLMEHAKPLGDLKSDYGTHLVLGNHEFYAKEQPWIVEFRRLGMRVLLNEHAVVAHKGEKVVVAGVTDFTAGHFCEELASDPSKAIAGAPADAGVRILLAHQPRSAAQAEGLGYQLQLSGHTHGGQFFPWSFFVPMQQPMVKGLYRRFGMWVYVHCGTGFWGPPKRLFAPSEIAKIRLVCA